ncbi:hypothetical protein GCM10022207_81550 [Streptomyces lannensis]|uniref:Uncharacterized protein n=1 Tax=Streptomyces lannensis TaxID=766498 RepID=A0ABP7LGF4_9ACTN
MIYSAVCRPRPAPSQPDTRPTAEGVCERRLEAARAVQQGEQASAVGPSTPSGKTDVSSMGRGPKPGRVRASTASRIRGGRNVMRDAVFNGFSTGWVTAGLSVTGATLLSMGELEFM